MKANIQPFSISLHPRPPLSTDIAVNRMNVPCIILNAIRNRKLISTSVEITGIFRTLMILENVSASFFNELSWTSDSSFESILSSSQKYARLSEISERRLEKRQGSRYSYSFQKLVSKTPPMLVAGSERMPPMNGPIMKPSPNAAPNMPILLGIISGVLISPIYARATAIFPLPAPDKNLAIMAISRLFDSPKTMKKTELDTRPNMITGLLPIRSLSDPRIGVKRN